ncbi:hypothetical protein LI328DRAFT_60223 [Trichoderma asperelloides]|nr:hypothetical protein LI328DRAFT_60223 [Trichoderma asperelloides]
MPVYIYKKLLQFPPRKGNKSYYLILITTIHATTTTHVISRLYSGPISLSSHLAQRQAPLPKQKQLCVHLLFLIHFQTFKKKKRQPRKKGINKKNCLSSTSSLFPVSYSVRAIKSTICCYNSNDKGEIYSLREWGGLRRYSSLECRKKARNEGSEKQCGKTGLKENIVDKKQWKQKKEKKKKEKKRKRKNIMHRSTKKKKKEKGKKPKRGKTIP